MAYGSPVPAAAIDSTKQLQLSEIARSLVARLDLEGVLEMTLDAAREMSGEGVLGELIGAIEPLRLAEIGDHPTPAAFLPATRRCTASSACRSGIRGGEWATSPARALALSTGPVNALLLGWIGERHHRPLRRLDQLRGAR
jgi:hypothetical protein